MGSRTRVWSSGYLRFGLGENTVWSLCCWRIRNRYVPLSSMQSNFRHIHDTFAHRKEVRTDDLETCRMANQDDGSADIVMKVTNVRDISCTD